jgi:hypothetical protein
LFQKSRSTTKAEDSAGQPEPSSLEDWPSFYGVLPFFILDLSTHGIIASRKQDLSWLSVQGEAGGLPFLLYVLLSSAINAGVSFYEKISQ